MSSLFDDAGIEVACERCGHKTMKTIGWIKSHTQLTCQCGTLINIDSSQLQSGLKEVDRSLEDFKKTLRKFGK